MQHTDEVGMRMAANAHFVWTVREAGALAILPWLVDAQAHEAFASVRFFVTRGGEGEKEGDAATLMAETLSGRPNVDDIIEHLARDQGAHRVVVFACGPSAMVDVARKTCRRLGTDFHSEVFMF